MSVRFFLEENGFSLPGSSPEQVVNLVERFCDLTSKIREKGEQISKWSQLEYEQVRPGYHVYDLLYGDGLPAETKQRFIQAVNRCSHWDDGNEEVIDEFQIEPLRFLGATLAHAFLQSLLPRAVVCTGFQWGFEPGLKDVLRMSDAQNSLIEFRVESGDLHLHYRRRIETENVSEDHFVEVCTHAFPNLFFTPGLKNQLRRFHSPYEELRPLIVRDLAGLNDHFQRIFHEKDGSPFETSREMSPLCGVDISKEGAITRGNADAMKAREVIVEGKTVSCEWHSKLHPNIDRIYFHPGTPELVNNRLIVGIFADHL